jgi:SAM-dependent methyltransferase
VSVNFDRIADRYDDTRGGTERGALVASALTNHLGAERPLLEIGVGTGLVAQAMGSGVVGIDISTSMLGVARDRLPGRLAQADASCLPFADNTFAGAYAVWVLHLVADPVAVLREVGRVLRAGAAFPIESAERYTEADEIQSILAPLYDAILAGRPRQDTTDSIEASAKAAGLAVDGVHDRQRHFEQRPSDVAASIETRAGSAFWAIDDAQWARDVEPAIKALRDLPEPDRARARAGRLTTVVLRKPG